MSEETRVTLTDFSSPMGSNEASRQTNAPRVRKRMRVPRNTQPFEAHPPAVAPESTRLLLPDVDEAAFESLFPTVCVDVAD